MHWISQQKKGCFIFVKCQLSFLGLISLYSNKSTPKESRKVFPELFKDEIVVLFWTWGQHWLENIFSYIFVTLSVRFAVSICCLDSFSYVNIFFVKKKVQREPHLKVNLVNLIFTQLYSSQGGGEGSKKICAEFSGQLACQ